MKLNTLLQTVNLNKVIDVINNEYNESNLEGYQQAIENLLDTEPTPQTGSIIVAREEPDILNPDPWIHVSLIDADGSPLAMSFVPWKDLLDREVIIKDCDLTPEQLLAHILWEITFYGYNSEECEEKGKELFDIKDDLDALLETLPENPTQEDYDKIGLTTFNPEDFGLGDKEDDND